MNQSHYLHLSEGKGEGRGEGEGVRLTEVGLAKYWCGVVQVLSVILSCLASRVASLSFKAECLAYIPQPTKDEQNTGI